MGTETALRGALLNFFFSSSQIYFPFFRAVLTLECVFHRGTGFQSVFGVVVRKK